MAVFWPECIANLNSELELACRTVKHSNLPRSGSIARFFLTAYALSTRCRLWQRKLSKPVLCHPLQPVHMVAPLVALYPYSATSILMIKLSVLISAQTISGLRIEYGGHCNYLELRIQQFLLSLWSFQYMSQICSWIHQSVLKVQSQRRKQSSHCDVVRLQITMNDWWPTIVV